MGTDVRRLEIPPGGLDTPAGRLYPPAEGWRPVLVVAGAVFAGPALGWVIGHVPGDLSDTARTALAVPYPVVFFLGYGVWIARLRVVVFDALGRSLLTTLYELIVHRRRPRALEDVIPSRDRLVAILVRAQRAGSSFALVGWLVGIAAGIATWLFETAMHPAALAVLVTVSCVAWGHLLAWLGRHGRLPLPEES